MSDTRMETIEADCEARIQRILAARDETERALIGALTAMLDTALATDDAAGLERSLEVTQC